MIERREIALYIILTLITCGIFGIFWMYMLLKDLYTVNNQPNNAGVDILLSFVTCGIYGIYLYYKMGKMVDTARVSMGLPSKDNSTLFLLIIIISMFFGMSFVVMLVIFGMIQDDLNSYIGPEYNRWQYGYIVENSTTPPGTF